jgi:hypothetical protein
MRLYNANNQVVYTATAFIYPQTIQCPEPWKTGFDLKGGVKFTIPQSLQSGVYFIEKKHPIVVKSRTPADITVVFPSNTINAYTNSGGKGLYAFNSSNKTPATSVSFKRPLDDLAEINKCSECLKWFLSKGEFSFRYIADNDLESSQSLTNTKLLVIAGHSEYWSRNARSQFDAFVNNGGNALILSGNTMWWQVRYSVDSSDLICYRDAGSDPTILPLLKTITWDDLSLQYPVIKSIGSDFNHGGYGLDSDNGWDGYKIVNGKSPLLEGLNLNRGDIVKAPSTECDGAPISGFDEDGFPVLENRFSFDKLELIGYDKGSRLHHETYPTFIIFKKNPTSGIVINVGSTDWCSANGIGNLTWGHQIQTITYNAISKLMNGLNVFSEN